ncbi:hypothetical protein DL98DRAFT_536103 [Cadophora sp. DSE1049]|nr:hypothetical protein DL98DRAFT_536103 [Cadophora sp. DSE1049]
MSFPSIAASALNNHQQDQTLTTDHDKPISTHLLQIPSNATTLTSSKVEVSTSDSTYAMTQTSVTQGQNVDMEASTLPMAGDDLRAMEKHAEDLTLANLRHRGEVLEQRGYFSFRDLDMTPQRISMSRTSQSTWEGYPMALPAMQLRDDFPLGEQHVKSQQPEPEIRGHPQQLETSLQQTLLSLNAGPLEDLQQPRQQRNLSIQSILNKAEAADKETSSRQRSRKTNHPLISSDERLLYSANPLTASSTLFDQQKPPNMADRRILNPRSPSARAASTGRSGRASIGAQPLPFLSSSEQVHMVGPGPKASSKILQTPTSPDFHYQQQYTIPPTSSEASPAPFSIHEGGDRPTQSSHWASPFQAVIPAEAMKFQGASRVTEGPKRAARRRAQNAAASARFRQRGKENETQATTTITSLQQQVRDLQWRAQAAEKERDRYRLECDRLRDLLHSNPQMRHLA